MSEIKAKNLGGRPLKYKSVDEMQVLIDGYFEKCDREKRPYTVSGLAFELDMDRQGLIEYGERDEFADALKKAKARVQAYAEEGLWNKQNPAGVIFSLKNNYGWKDKQEIDASISGSVTVKWED